MGSTANYSFSYPAATDYVKDGYANIQTLATQVDTALNSALSTKPAMAVLLNTTTFTTASTVIIDNVFSASYQNYAIKFVASQNTATGYHTMRLRASGVDNTMGFYGGGVQNYANSNTLYSYRMNGGADYTMGSSTLSLGVVAVDINLFAPQQNVLTRLNHRGVGDDAVGSYSHGLDAWYNGATQFDGIKFATSGGTFTGTVRIYGLRNS